LTAIKGVFLLSWYRCQMLERYGELSIMNYDELSIMNYPKIPTGRQFGKTFLVRASDLKPRNTLKCFYLYHRTNNSNNSRR
jgi:hypothetical protein